MVDDDEIYVALVSLQSSELTRLYMLDDDNKPQMVADLRFMQKRERDTLRAELYLRYEKLGKIQDEINQAFPRV